MKAVWVLFLVMQVAAPSVAPPAALAPASPSSAPNVPAALPPANITQRALAGTVLLVTTLKDGLASYGSGIIVDSAGLILTNLHVLDGAQATYALRLIQPN